MGSIVLFAFGFVELLTHLFHGTSLLEMMLSHWRQMCPNNVAAQVLMTDPFLGTALILPTLANAALKRSARDYVTAPLLAQFENRRVSNGINLLVILCAVLALGSVQLVLRSLMQTPLDWGGPALYVCLLAIFTLRFVLLNRPGADQYYTVRNAAILAPLPDRQGGILQLPALTFALMEGMLQGESVRLISDKKVVYKSPNEVALGFTQHAVVRDDLHEMFPFNLWKLKIGGRIKVTGKPQEIVLDQVGTTLPDDAALQAEFTSLVRSQVASQLMTDADFGQMNENVRSMFQGLNAQLETTPEAVQERVGTINNIQIIVQEVKTRLKQMFVQQNEQEAYKLSGGLFYADLYPEEIDILPEMDALFEQNKKDVTQAIRQLVEDRQVDRAFGLDLLSKLTDLDVPLDVISEAVNLTMNGPALPSPQPHSVRPAIGVAPPEAPEGDWSFRPQKWLSPLENNTDEPENGQPVSLWGQPR